jgi:hypothetical protein
LKNEIKAKDLGVGWGLGSSDRELLPYKQEALSSISGPGKKKKRN